MESTKQQKFIKINVDDVSPWQETCGQIRCLIEEKDQTPCELHHLKITHSKLHYHKHTDEYYYILDGKGTMILDEVEVPLSEGDTLYIPRGCKHQAKGDLTVLVICCPRGVMNDIYELEDSSL